MASEIRSYWKDSVMNFYDHKNHPAFRSDLWANCPIQAIKCDPSLAHVFFTDFFEHTDGDSFTISHFGGTPAGTIGISAGIGGQYTTYADADDNDETYEISDGESWLFAEGKKLWFEVKYACTEGDTNKANYVFGLADAAGENFLIDNGAGPAATYDGAVFYKVDGTMNIYFESSNAGTPSTATTMKTTCVSGTSYRLGFYYDGAPTTGIITPYIDGVAKTATSIANSGLAEMELFFGVKAGGGTPEEYLVVDWIKCVQLR